MGFSRGGGGRGRMRRARWTGPQSACWPTTSSDSCLAIRLSHGVLYLCIKHAHRPRLELPPPRRDFFQLPPLEAPLIASDDSDGDDCEADAEDKQRFLFLDTTQVDVQSAAFDELPLEVQVGPRRCGRA